MILKLVVFVEEEHYLLNIIIDKMQKQLKDIFHNL
jgi:hypothetical protein